MDGEDDGTPLQYSCLENPMDGGAWWAAVHAVGHDWSDLAAAAAFTEGTWVTAELHGLHHWQQHSEHRQEDRTPDPAESGGIWSLPSCVHPNWECYPCVGSPASFSHAYVA